MWTKEHRAKALAETSVLKRYPSDLTNDEWSVIAPLMPAASRIRRPCSVGLREVINAIRQAALLRGSKAPNNSKVFQRHVDMQRYEKRKNMNILQQEVDERSTLAGNNKMELLLFYLGSERSGGSSELYGINVF